MINTRLLRRIIKHIQEEPRRYDQESTLNPNSVESPCGTQACIGGWACFLTAKTKRGREHFSWLRAKRVLGLTEKQAKRLMAYIHSSYGTRWPRKFRNQYLNTTTPAGRVRVAVRRIEHFIKTKGEE